MRFIYCCLCKLNNENFETTIDADETTVEIIYCTSQSYNKPEVSLIRAAKGKVGKPKHNFSSWLYLHFH